MFLDVICRRNPALVTDAIALHQQGRIPANSYVIDLDTVRANASQLRAAGDRHRLKVFAMTKQMGRNPAFCRALLEGGIVASVAVDMECARVTHRAGLRIGNIGHLVQVPRAEADAAAALAPDYWTVFNDEKAAEAAAASRRRERSQALLARIQAPDDLFYKGHEGGFDAAAAATVADRLDALDGARFAGITTFPALLFDHAQRRVLPTRNLHTLEAAAERLAAAGRRDLQINAPGTNSAVMFEALAAAGATQVEPGHGLTGTTALHAVEDLPERPAAVYLTEVSHHYGGRAYCFGGGLYVDPIFPAYEVKAVVAAEPTATASARLAVEIPPAEAIDYYGMIDVPAGRVVRPGDSVVFGFRIQAFVTRAYVVGVAGIGTGSPTPQGIFTAQGAPTSWPA
jgi:predicted amino acid racemase